MTLVQNRLTDLFERRFGEPPGAIVDLAGDGSSRSYWRLTGSGGESVVGAFGPDHEENEAFFSFTHAFHGIGLPVPELFGTDPEVGVWLEEDLGDTTLFQALTAARDQDPSRFPASIVELYRGVVELLPRFQVEGAAVVDFSRCYPRSAFDRRSMLWDLNYFKYHFLKLAQIPFSEARLEEDFHTLTEYLLEVPGDGFLYRDFQSRNILVQEGRPRFIDYQGGRRGPPHYDIASLLYDAKVDMPEAVREDVLDHYLQALAQHMEVDEADFRAHLRGYVLIRIMQAMGAYGYRGFFERKPRFLQSVPFAAANLGRIVEAGLPVDVPEMEQAFRRIADAWGAGAGSGVRGKEGLSVRIRSFSYAGGYPEDRDGHGGGYVFDCRGLPNPGRLREYRSRSGLDDDVVAYLEDAPEVEAFWSHVQALADAHVDDYLRRGFDHLSISFGCTGGQHRSVYFAERLAKQLRDRYPNVSIHVEHRERARWTR